MLGSDRSGAALALTASLLAAACTSAPVQPIAQWDPDGGITTPMQDIPESLDPLRTNSSEQVRHIAMMFEALITLDPKTLAPVPAAARDLPTISNDGLTYTFELREGLKYSDGSPLAAKDFAYAISRICDPALGPPGTIARLIAGCAAVREMDPTKTAPADLTAAKNRIGVRSNGERELVVVLTEPAAYFIVIVTGPVAYPVRASDVAKAGDAYGTRASIPIGNGPFKLVEWTPDQRLVFERNEHYRTPAKLKRWTKVQVGLDVALAAYRNDEIDFYGGVPYRRVAAVAENLAAIEADPVLRAERVEAQAAITDLFLLNMTRPPFNDRSIRQAFAKAVDREALIRDFLSYGQPALSLIPPGRPGHDPGDTFQRFDADRAKQFLQSSTLVERPELSSIRLVFDLAPTRSPAELLQQQVKRNLGIDIRLEQVDTKTFTQMWSDPRSAPEIRFIRVIGPDPDPHFWFTPYRSTTGSAVQIGYRNLEFDALVNEAGRLRDPQRRADLYRRASRILSEDVPAIWFYWPPNAYLRKARVKGVTDSAADFEYGLLRITEIYVTKRS